MPKHVTIYDRRVVFNQAIFRIEEARLQHERYDGSMSEKMVRLCLERGDSVAALLHNPLDDTVVMTEQFRYPTYEKGPGWLLELPAGMVEAGEDPAETMKRELIEEIGFVVNELEHISTFYLSPGGTSERILLYYASVSPGDKVTHGGGLLKEGEDIRTVFMTFAEARQKVASGEIADAKTIIALQWLQLRLQD